MRNLTYANLRDGLVGAWCAGYESHGLMAKDYSDRGNHGVLTNGPVWTPTERGATWVFDGTDDEISTPFAEHSDSFSIVLWINILSASVGYIISKWDNTSSGSTWRIGGDGGSGKSIFETRTNGGTNEQLTTSSNLLRLGGMYHVAFTRNSDSGLKEIYISGNLDNSATQTTGALKSNTTIVRVGTAGASACAAMHCIESRVYSRVLTAAEIYEDFMAGPGWLPRRRRSLHLLGASQAASPLPVFHNHYVSQGIV